MSWIQKGTQPRTPTKRVTLELTEQEFFVLRTHFKADFSYGVDGSFWDDDGQLDKRACAIAVRIIRKLNAVGGW